ncbi:YciI family protein [Anaeromyxobacter dehalogenans]|uniref:DGPFAETKE n=1 Tax=Anaeromyxobacter dehalogenans (strain 2CP-C) TaxID=290397 RepID=Q2IFA7_ANADE|nr:YciI family protein [Anaeromyxobacter dehalogenans]ABC83266.1 DGPFAETKE [Anaeromyxobacter dehalogenans 2CP-C]
MRFMMIVKASPESESGAPPSRELIQAMTRYNEELVNAGVLLAGDGLLPSSKGARVKFSKGKVEVVDGPFAETKELVAGFWMIQVKSKEEAIAWARRCPNPMGEGAEGVLELRQVAEAADFPPEVLTPEDAAKEVEIFERAKRNAANR